MLLSRQTQKDQQHDGDRNQTVPKRLAGIRSAWRSTRVLEQRTGNQLRTKPREFSLRRDSDFGFDWEAREDDFL
jgi:hypothetical protein